MLRPADLFLPIRALGAKLRARDFTPLQLTQAYLERSQRLGPGLNAYATLTAERALRQARQATEELAAGHDRGPLHGIPYAAKDLLAVAGYPTTWGAKPYENQHFDTDATVIQRLDQAGAILIGKAAMIELAGGLGYSGPHASLTGPCHNPWNTAYWTCGSSSGSGAIMAAGLAGFALGSDTRGSIICPSTQCGISGMRPSFGRVSRHGVMTIAWTMDKIGPMGRSADCLALILATIAGHDPLDWDSLPEAQAAFAPPPERPLRIGRLTNVFPHARPELHQAVERALAVLQAHGASVADAAFPAGPYEQASELVILIEAASAYSELIASGRCALLEDPLGQINGYASSQFSATDYIQLQRLRLQLARQLEPLFEQFDVLAAPGQGSTASLINPPARAARGGPGRGLGRGGRGGRGGFVPDSLQPDGISSLCGLPAVTVPAGLAANHLPIGVQFLAAALNDGAALGAARQLQAHSDWHRQHPPAPYGPADA
ncbi:MAG TPA: amidase [Terriglobales bacterium]|nr:amidase [Terriglobales bacterium]